MSNITNSGQQVTVLSGEMQQVWYYITSLVQNHPDFASIFVACPFNVHHLVPRDQLSKRITTCTDKTFFEDDVDKSSENAWQYVSSGENWHKD
ncbi:gametocyte-specific factor 1-like [Dipodomys merriami]|uniref:gametocyte-specific factor 1-like n=1 Tax=Dipodomys merriami TaxID=94247 RepID=UPI003855BB0D